jgi:Cof subfamily protein (haloacid dehalogenase superfamily)
VTLVVFDLDGTLLNAKSQLSEYTRDTLGLMRAAGIPYTVATGRTLQAALGPLRTQQFTLPHILKNGAMIWCPQRQDYSHSHLLTQQEVWHVITAMTMQEVTPFAFTLEEGGHHAVYHGPLNSESDKKLAQLFEDERQLPAEPLKAMPDTAHVICLSGMGPSASVQTVIDMVADEDDLVAYTGTAIQDQNMRWMDVHHSQGSKGSGITTLRDELDLNEVIVFGDGENDLSMFAVAQEAYATANANPALKETATDVIGHHDEDGVARFLRKRFSL